MAYRSHDELMKEVEIIKQIDILQLATDMGYTFRKSGRICICKNDKGLTLYTNTNTFYHFYEARGGSVIDFYMAEKGLAFPEAVKELLDIANYRGIVVPVNIEEKSRKSSPNFTLPKRNENHKRAFAYLVKSRGLDAALVSKMLHEGRIYEEAAHHNVVFLATDTNKNIKHGFIRGTISGRQWRGDVEDSDKDYGFNVDGTDDTLCVFEAPIDALSYACLKKDTTHHLLATGMLSERPILKYIEEHPGIKKIAFILDNDKKGIEASNRFSELLSEKYQIINDDIYYKLVKSGIKDVNELLQKTKKLQAELTGGRTNARQSR